MRFRQSILRICLPWLLCWGSYHALAAPAADLIVRGDYVLTMREGQDPIEDGAVVINGGVITAVGSWADIGARYRAKQVLPGRGRVLMPGLINGHTHSAMTLFRGMADDLDLMTWLNDFVFPMEARFVNPEFVRIGTELACWEMIQGGTTTFVDMYFYPDVIAQVVDRCGLRAIIAAPTIDFPSPGFRGWDDAFAAATDFVERWQGRHPRITPAFAPHSAYTVAPEHLRQLAIVAGRLGATVSIHLAEAPVEIALVRKKYATTPVRHLLGTGLLDTQIIGAHMVHLNAEDIRIAADKSLGAIHNPTSNLKLAAGISPVVDMIKAGVNVGLGTDGATSNNDLDLWEEMRLAALLHKYRGGDPTAMPAPAAIRMATSMGARAIGMGEVIGELVAGKQADLIQVDFTRTRQAPLYNITSHLVYVLDSQDVVTTIVAGNILMLERQVLTLDEDSIRAAVEKKRLQITAALRAAD